MSGDLRRRVADIRALFNHLAAGCIAVVSNEPYEDDPRWTPWTRFIAPRLADVDEALSDLAVALDADPDTPTADAAAGADLSERMGDAVLNALCNSPVWENRHVGDVDLQVADDWPSYPLTPRETRDLLRDRAASPQPARDQDETI